MRKRLDKRREGFEKEEFQAYGEYTYDYLHAAGEADGAGDAQPAASPSPARVKHVKPVHAKKKRMRGWMVFLVALVIATVALIVVMETLFRIQSVYVIGNEQKTPQQIVAQSGLVRGESIFAIREEDVERALTGDHTIIFKGMEKDYPSTIYLYIEERKPVAVMQWIGMKYLLDESGLVMSEQSNLTIPEGMPVVTGFRIGSANVGQQLSVRSAKQLEAYQEIMKELRLQDYAAQITEISLGNPSRIYLITKEGVSVILGDGDYMRAKIGAVRTYMAYLRQLGKASGTLDVSIPEDAKFMPDS